MHGNPNSARRKRTSLTIHAAMTKRNPSKTVPIMARIMHFQYSEDLEFLAALVR
jgi:hypothetical protein